MYDTEVGAFTDVRFRQIELDWTTSRPAMGMLNKFIITLSHYVDD